MKTTRSMNRSGIIPLIEKAFSAATRAIGNQLDQLARKSATDALDLPRDTEWPDFSQHAEGRSVPHRFRR